jgi:ABC-type phosphate transport system ATPase subunit
MEGENAYSIRKTDVIALRRAVDGLPETEPFPMSIYENVAMVPDLTA